VNPLGVRIADSSTELVAAFDGRRTILLTAEWPKPIERETPTIRARLIDSFATNVARAGSDVTFSGETQRTVSGAANDGTMLVLTIEGRGTLRHPNGSTTRVQAGLPEQRYGFVESVVAAQDVFLVVYRTGHSPLTGVAVRCVRHDGRVLEPLFLPTRENAREPAAATDGNAFLVVWNDAREDVQGARIGTDGTLESVFPIAAAGGALGNIEMAWTGEVFVLAGRTANGLGIARVTADGSQLGGLQSFPGAPGIEHERTSMAVGTSGDGALVLRAVEGCLLAVPVSRDGRVLREPRSVLCDQNFGVWPDLEIVWDGSAYTVAWSAELFVEGIPAVRTMRDGTVVTPVQNLDSSGGELADGTLLRAGEEVYLLYHRVVAEAPYAGVSRAFLRTVEVAGAPRRTRAARR
jgi:hypothetical protein